VAGRGPRVPFLLAAPRRAEALLEEQPGAARLASLAALLARAEDELARVEAALERRGGARQLARWRALRLARAGLLDRLRGGRAGAG